MKNIGNHYVWVSSIIRKPLTALKSQQFLKLWSTRVYIHIIIYIINTIYNQGVHSSYISIINTMYNQGTSTVRLHKDSNKINIDKGVRRGDIVSPKLFNAALERIFRRLDWDRKGININDNQLSYLRFADDIVLTTNNAEGLEEMLNDLNKESNNIGLRINMKKTKVTLKSNKLKLTMIL